jgi:hypothetical protein
MATAEQRIRTSSEVCLRQAGDEGILYDTKQKKIHVINATAAFIWQCCEETGDREQVLDAVVRRFGVGADVAARDVDEILEVFRELGLVDFVH